VIPEFRVSGRSDLDAGEAENRKSDAPMDEAMEMATAVTSIAVETAYATIFERMENNDHANRRWWSEVPVAPSDCRCGMGRTISQQAQELTQLH
jgi:hypothetical protein